MNGNSELGCKKEEITIHQKAEYFVIYNRKLSDMLYWQRNNFILVDRFVGLTKGVVFQAAKILNQ
jgi:hypothetical protein